MTRTTQMIRLGVRLLPVIALSLGVSCAGPAPTSSSPSPSPTASGADLVSSGKTLFSSKGCDGCHGADAKGAGSVPNIRGKTYDTLKTEQASGATMKGILTGVSDDDLKALGAYLQSLT